MGDRSGGTSAADVGGHQRVHPRHAADRRIVRNHIAYRGPIVIDARLKPTFPKELAANPATAARVTRRWKEYFPSGQVAMGDAERAHLD